jgi:hypothetical protein
MSKVDYIELNDIQLMKRKSAPHYYSASGYGAKIPIGYMLKIANRWHRVYVMHYSNSATSYVVIKGLDYFLSSDVEHALEILREWSC